MSGVSFGYPSDWTACRFPGSVSPGPLIEVEPPGMGEGTGPLTVQIVAGAGSFEENLDLDRDSLPPDAEYSRRTVKAPGATEAVLTRYRGNAFGFDFAGSTVYAQGKNVYAKVSWYSAPGDAENGEQLLRAVVASLDLEAADEDTDLEDCSLPEAPTPRPAPKTEEVPAAISGVYEMTMSPDQLRDAEHLERLADYPRWTLILQGEELEAVGKNKTGDARFTFPILEASARSLVLEGIACEPPPEPMEITMTFAADRKSLEVLGVRPGCSRMFRELLMMNVWKKTYSG
jgi:hypothetical protein